MQHFKQWVKLCSLALMFIAALAPTSWAQKQQPASSLHLYDTFNQKFIDPAKWSSVWQCGPPALDCVREIQNDHLRLGIRAYGATDSNSGTQFAGSSVNLTASSVTDIAAQVVVRKSSSQDCATNSGVAHSQVLIYGAFFNGGGGTASDDVQAYLQLDRYATDAPGAVEVGGFLQYQGQFFGNIDLGPVNLGEQVVVELQWNQPAHQFIARLSRPASGTKVELSMPYTISDTAAAVAPFKSLSANVFPANCAGSSAAADLDVLFDRVKTN
jgi:hypothetical protein